jgi:predicted MFS family arabinose efflux permease
MKRAASFYLLASLSVSFLASSSAPTPIYPLYQAQWGFSPVTVTLVFGIYAVAVLGSLLVAGRLSDHLGRRPVLLVATAVQAVTMAMFATAQGLPDLLAARVIQGLATGAALAAIGAGMLDLDKARGAVANAVAPTLGTATGAILAGVLVRYLPAPTHLVFALLGAIFVLQFIGIATMAETVAPRPGALASLRPQLALPAAARGPMLLAIPALVASWSLAGFYGSLGPALVKGMMGSASSLLGGVALFVMASSAAISVWLMHAQAARTMLRWGAVMLLAGVAVSIAAVTFKSLAPFLLGTAMSGVGFGAGFQGAVRSVVPLAAPHERAGVLSVAFVVSYLAMGVPAVVAGYLVGRHGNIVGTAQEFGAVVMGLAALALWGSLRGARLAPATA